MMNTAVISQPIEDGKPSLGGVPSREAFDELKNIVSKYWSTEKQLPANKDTLSIYDFSTSFVQKNTSTIARQRQPAFTEVLKSEVSTLLGEDVAQSVTKQLQNNHSFSTAQHFSSIIHQRTLNATLQSALPYFNQQSDEYKNVLVVSCANISFDNPWFPRGILFHSLTQGALTENRFPFFSRKVRPYPIRNHPGYALDAVQTIKVRIHEMKNENLITDNAESKMMHILDTVYADPKVLACKTFSEQKTITNYKIWQEIFTATSQGLSIPNLVFMEQENIVLKLLEKHHMNQDTLIHQLLFDPEVYPLIEKYFDTIQGGFSLEKGYGTFLFWALPKDQKYRLQLFRKDNVLVSSDESFRVELTPESIGEKIRTKELIPSTLLSLTLLSLYYGYILTGGLAQPEYLTQMQKAYLTIATEVGDKESVAACIDIPTKNHTITRPTLAYITGSNDARNAATGLDLILYGRPNSWSEILEASKYVSITDLLHRALPSVYEDYVPEEAKTETASAVTEREIEKITGLDQKVPAWVSLT